MKRINGLVIWPAYIDSNKTRSQGRRVPKRLAVKSPRLDEIAKAARDLGFNPKVYPEKAYPKAPYEKSGVVVVTGKAKKTDLLKKLAARISEAR
ncbi:signal recognition particle protein Srp19 [Candidatus Bathyarchaeota archaeon]|nr:signal recognition particle protein Srp19 [Candidatus Bathyarchaeota archaeon]